MTKTLKNEKGALTLDFIFALIMVMGTTVVFGMFCFTLSLVEIIQYTAFSSSRGYYAGHVTKKKQIELAEGVFEELVNGKFAFFLSPKKGWFEIKPNFGDFRQEYNSSDPSDVFEGARFAVQAKILGFAVPFIGTTERNAGYKTVVTSFLGREVSSEECMGMIAQRYESIKKLDNTYAEAKAVGYAVFDDNGC